MTFAAVLLESTTTGTTVSTASGYSVGWFALALINAGLAQSHGRSGLNWFLISILLGPFATLILVLQYKKT
jgi:hypothetical protein